MTKTLKEDLSCLAHEIWSHWTEYMLSVGEIKEDGILIPKEKVERWNRQINTHYYDLSEQEKESDKNQADKMLKVIRKHIIMNL